MSIKPKIIKCRGVVTTEDKILLAKHRHNDRDFYAFLGGHLEGEENGVKCAERELLEETGIKPEIGKLMYVNQYTEEDKDYLEFFFEVKNVNDYLDISKFNGVYGYELTDIVWVNKNDSIEVMPKKIFEDFIQGKLKSNKNIIFI